MHFIVSVTNDKQQKDKMPAEESAKASFLKFRDSNLKFIDHDKHNNS